MNQRRLGERRDVVTDNIVSRDLVCTLVIIPTEKERGNTL